jgi:hypothetical protein
MPYGTINVDKVVDTSGGILAPISSVFRNRIINGAMVIDQRNAGASVTPTNGSYLVDRWKYAASQASKFTAQQNAGSVTPPTGFKNYLGLTVASSVSIATGDYFLIRQNIEGFNIADLDWGTANAKTVTLSFWVRSSLTGTFGGSFENSASNRSYPFTYTISAANTWEQKTITVAGDTTGTWVTNNGTGIQITFSLGIGSDYSGTAGSWANADYGSATGATSVVGTNGATFYITGVQLEKGSTATSFDYRPYGTEFMLCQRYCMKWLGNQLNENIAGGSFNAYSSTGAQGAISTPVTMRTTPTITFGTLGFTDVASINNAVSALTIATGNSGPNSLNLEITTTGMTTGRTGYLYARNSLSAFLIASAEL